VGERETERQRERQRPETEMVRTERHTGRNGSRDLGPPIIPAPGR
jgi:hypothetical protein